MLEEYLNSVRVPDPLDKVYKDECVYCFDTPESPDGLYVCLNTWMGYSSDCVKKFHEKTGNRIFLLMKRIKREDPEYSENKNVPSKISRLAIGVEGGFPADSGRKYIYDEKNSIVVLPEWKEVKQKDFTDCLPEKLKLCITGILSAQSALKQQELESLSGTWDGEARIVTKHADTLLQLDNGVKVPAKGWKCEFCDKTDNLWLNLSDGKILCGRKFFDGSGGNNHAVEYYKQKGYPLAVKLGTITPEGKADVYSYDEDDMVLDPNLEKHLKHFGIDMKLMAKTDKSMIELELDLNQRIGEWTTIQESDKQLQPLYGPGYTGLINLGNSCYLNSVMQVVFTIPDFINCFVTNADAIFNSTGEPYTNFNVQMAKLGEGLFSGKYSKSPSEQQLTDSKDIDDLQPGISPTYFKYLIGIGHPEFSTKRQQDAQEFVLHLINMCEKNSRKLNNPADCFKFKAEDRIECSVSHCVSYVYKPEYMLPLQIPLHAASNKSQVDEYDKLKAEVEAKGEKMPAGTLVRPRIPLQACLDAFTEVAHIPDFYSTAINAKTTVLKTCRFATFPDYLFIHLKKFWLDDAGNPHKLDVSMEVPDSLDLTALRGHGRQPAEAELHEPETPAVTFDEEVIAQLCSMGFTIDACKRAIFNTNNEGIEPALNWIMEHIADPHLNDKFTVPGTASTDSSMRVNAEGVAMIESMGFTRQQAEKALRSTNDNVERAIDWIFSHPEELGDEEVSRSYEYRDGSPKYQLVGFISHMGASTACGHYVCHVYKDDKWVIYNDNKVAISENPPRDLAYLYLYKRIM